MASQELRLTVPVDRARQLVGNALAEQGFTVQDAAGGSLEVSRGSLGTTLVAGAFAGEDMHVRFDVDLLPAGNGSIARVNGPGAGGFLKGGAIGASKANDVVREAAHRLGVQLSAQGVLEGSVATDAESSDSIAASASASVAAASGEYPAPPSSGGYAPQQAWGGGGIPAPIDYANRTNVVAIVALILGFIVPIGGIIAGAVALAQVKRTGEKGRGLAIGGIVVGSALTVLLIVGAIGLFVIGITASQIADSQGPTTPIPTESTPFDQGDPSDPPAEDPESVDVFSLAIGDCINDTGGDEVTTVEATDCAAPHDQEVFSEFELTGETFPGADQVQTLADDGCYQAFAGFAGIAFEDSTLDYTYYVPTQESWETGDDRLVSCLIFEPDVQSVGTLAGAAR